MSIDCVAKKARWPFLVALALVATALFALQLPQRTEARTPVPQPIRAPLLSAPAVIEPASHVIELQSQVQGRLRVVNTNSGEAIEEGQLLAELDNDMESAMVSLREAEVARAEAVLARLRAGARAEQRLQAKCELRRADAALKGAEVDLKRVRTLTERGVQTAHALDSASAQFQVNRAARDRAQARLDELEAGERVEVIAEAQAELARARAAQRLAQAQLERTQIRSPLDGICVYRFREPGEVVGRVSEQVPVLTVASAGKLRLRADVDASDVDRVWIGQQVTATAPAFSGKTFTGTVIKREPTLGRKNFRTDRPREKIDTKVLEVVIELDEAADLPLGLQMTTIFLER